MREFARVVALVEGPTERIFVSSILPPYLFNRAGVSIQPIVLSKAGQKGGDVRFERARRDIAVHLKQRSDTWVTLLVDYYGIDSRWPGYRDSRKIPSAAGKARRMNEATATALRDRLGQNLARRFIPHLSMFEFEALLFSEPDVLARHTGVPILRIRKILDECREPENIDDSPQGAPSKRLAALAGRFRKTKTGIAIAREIGVERMGAACPLFAGWIRRLEGLGGRNGR